MDPMDLFSLASHNPQSRVRHKDPKPTHLNTLNSSAMFQLVSADKLSVSYVGDQQHDHDVGAVQSDRPAPTRTLAYYFEMTVKSAGERGQLAIGFTGPGYNLRRHPGWEPDSCGYHGENGYIFRGNEKGEPFGPTYTTGDIVGAGINYATQEFFFTKNGKLIGTLDKYVKGSLYPTVAVHGQKEEVTINFGKQSFSFDIKAYKSEERLKQQKLIEKQSLPSNVSHSLIRSYLLHYGYQDTLNSLDQESEIPILPTAQQNVFDEGDAYALNHRKILRQLIKKGDIDSTFRSLREWYPQIVQNETSTICFLLHSQRFIEYVKEEQLLDAVTYGRAELQKFLNLKQFEDFSLLMDALALLGYSDPLQASLGYLLEPAQREFIADAVNIAVLMMNPNLSNVDNCKSSRLEKILRQITACSLEKRALSEGQGDAFDLHKEECRWGWGKI